MFKRSQVAALNDILAKVNAMQKTVRDRHCRVARDKPETAALAGHGDLSDAPQERGVEQGVRQRRARGHCTDRGANRPGGGERRQVRLVRKRQARARHQQGGMCAVVSGILRALLTACGLPGRLMEPSRRWTASKSLIAALRLVFCTESMFDVVARNASLTRHNCCYRAPRRAKSQASYRNSRSKTNKN